MTKHLILLGDSVFDNGSYVLPGQADVTAHMKRKLRSRDGTLDMRAVDGAMVANVKYQLAAKPPPLPCTFVLSVGGNDALQYLDMISDPTRDQSFASVLMRFHEVKEGFRAEYTNSLELILEHGQPLVVCTIYNPVFPEEGGQRLAEAGLSFFNDVITEEAMKRNLLVIDLRVVCSSPSAFANPIEPSELGGNLITDAIVSRL